jgi:hypothetical protein
MLKKFKALIISILMAAILPTFKITGDNNPSNSSPHPEGTQGEESGVKEKIKELEGLMAGKEAELSQAKEKISGMEQAVSETAARLNEVDGVLKKTVTGYKALILQSNPEILPELINGDTMESLDNSLAKAKDLTNRIKENLKLQISNPRVPAGAPTRGREDASTLSAREKIREGMARK